MTGINGADLLIMILAGLLVGWTIRQVAERYGWPWWCGLVLAGVVALAAIGRLVG